MLRRFGRMTSDDARGFVIDLDAALERAGLTRARVTWRGGDDGLFTVNAQASGPAEGAVLALLDELDDVAYGGDACGATVTVAAGGAHVHFATWSPRIGLATVRIDVTDDRSTGDIAAR